MLTVVHGGTKDGEIAQPGAPNGRIVSVFYALYAHADEVIWADCDGEDIDKNVKRFCPGSDRGEFPIVIGSTELGSHTERASVFGSRWRQRHHPGRSMRGR